MNRILKYSIAIAVAVVCYKFIPKIFHQNMSSKVALRGLGYAFNDAGQLRQINPDTKFITDKPFKFDISKDAYKNQENYETVGEVITDYVYQLLLDMGLKKIYIPSPQSPDSSFVFGTKTKFANTEKLLILIHGSGVVRAGQWSRSLIINHSLEHGTQIPYIKRAIELGYDVLITNTNENIRIENGKTIQLKGSESPENHIVSVWKQLIEPVFDSIGSFAIVAHSYGGIVTLHLADKFPRALMNKCFAIGFTDSVHSISKLSGDMTEWIQLHSRNYVTSNEKLGTKLNSRENDIPLYAAGHTKHEFTSWACISEMFPYLEAEHEAWVKRRPSLLYPFSD